MASGIDDINESSQVRLDGWNGENIRLRLELMVSAISVAGEF